MELAARSVYPRVPCAKTTTVAVVIPVIISAETTVPVCTGYMTVPLALLPGLREPTAAVLAMELTVRRVYLSVSDAKTTTAAVAIPATIAADTIVPV